MCNFYPLDTFDIQKIKIHSLRNGSLLVYSEFMSNSRAKRLFIVFKCQDPTIEEFRALTRKNSESVLHALTSLPSGTCTALIYDLEFNGRPGSNPAREVSNVESNGKEVLECQ